MATKNEDLQRAVEQELDDIRCSVIAYDMEQAQNIFLT